MRKQIEPITKMTFKGSSNHREWQLMEKLNEVIEQLNYVTAYVDHVQEGVAQLLGTKAKSL